MRVRAYPIAVAAADVLAHADAKPIKVARLEWRELEGPADQQGLLVPERPHRIGVRAVGIRAGRGVGDELALVLAEGRTSLSPCHVYDQMGAVSEQEADEIIAFAQVLRNRLASWLKSNYPDLYTP